MEYGEEVRISPHCAFLDLILILSGKTFGIGDKTCKTSVILDLVFELKVKDILDRVAVVEGAEEAAMVLDVIVVEVIRCC